MNKTRKTLLGIVCLLASLTTSAQTTQHTISNGETIYAIARKYNITVSQLLNANPTLGDGNKILVGQRLNIPTANSAPTPQSNATPQNAVPQTAPTHITIQNDNTSTVSTQETKKGYLNSGIKEMYRVKKKDNLYRVALLYKLTIEELVAANPPLTIDSKIKKDDLLCIPFSKAELEADKRKAEQAAAEKAAAEARLINEAATKLRKHIKVGVLLPFKDGNERATKMIEFYRGVLLAADSLKKEGTTVEIHAFHSGSSTSDMHFLTNKESLKQMNLIFGPLDATQAAPLSEFCRQNKIRLVMPFATTNSFGLTNPYVYQATCTGDTGCRLGAQRMLRQFTNNTFTIIKTDAPDNRGTRFTNEISAELTRKGFPPHTITLKEDDAALAATLNQFRNNVIVTDATSLAAATGVSKRLSAFLQNHPEFHITLIGYPEWITYTQNLSTYFHTLDTYVYTSFYRNPNDLRVLNFEASYTTEFQHPMTRTFPRYGLMGFDLGYYFMHGLAQLGELFDTKQNTLSYNPLQNAFSFAQQNTSSAHVNEAVWLIHYTTDRQIEMFK